MAAGLGIQNTTNTHLPISARRGLGVLAPWSPTANEAGTAALGYEGAAEIQPTLARLPLRAKGRCSCCLPAPRPS
jgi:hypothetical protein